jgi:death-on-curing protein
LANEPIWVEPDGVVRLNAALVARTGEPHGLVSTELLESACSKPRNHWAYGERDLITLGSELLFGLARNHPFLQGNKRTAFAATIGFLEINGLRVALEDDVGWADHIIAVLQAEATQESFADRLRAAVGPARPRR